MLRVVESHKWFLCNVFCFLENKKEKLKSKFLILNQLSKLKASPIKIFLFTKTQNNHTDRHQNLQKIYYDYTFIYTYFKLIQCSIF
jgi:hypothetical protein